MFGVFEERVADKVELAEKEPSGSKVADLKEAVSTLIRPAMHLHIGHAYMRPNAAVYEICRRFWGSDPGFTVSSLGFIANMVLFVRGGLARRLITTFCGDSYPFPGPNRIYQEAFRAGRVEIENWTVLTLPQRLMAGALGVEWMPTHSLRGSSMQEENAEDFHLLDLPGGEVGMVRALRPDLTLLHAWAADAAGNVLLTPPYAEGVHAAFAAREGVLVTVEEVVPTSFLRRYSHFVKIPGYLVRAVCPAPLGVHPSGASNQGLKEFDAYAEDEDFMLELREACRSEEKMEEWVREWVLDVEDHDAYIEKLGYERIWHLKGRAASDSWKSELASRAPGIDASPAYSAGELMVVEASRLLAEKVRKEGYRAILAGIGASNLAAWKAWYDLRRDGIDVDLMAEVGFFGYAPRPGDPFIFNFRNIPTCTMLTDIVTVLGSMVGARSSRAIGALGAGQVDRAGNINSTRLPEYGLFLVGSGGACDVALGAREVLVTVSQDGLRTPERVSYITAPGERVRTLVTTMGVFEKPTDGDGFVLTAYFPALAPSEREAVEAIRAACGWELSVARGLRKVDEPTLDELYDVRIFDPRRYFLGDA
ncbi:MAG: glutaconate CoA-transferase [Actinobacteria bacterium]|nr:glutaconate CoA-transferase [Actinomycetota bacterium]MDI6831001.1 CoA-transferase [Actinomycetota bacterium]